MVFPPNLVPSNQYQNEFFKYGEKKNQELQQKKRKRKVRFLDNRRLASTVDFEQDDDVDTFRKNISRAATRHFRPDVRWRLPGVLRGPAAVRLKVNTKCESFGEQQESQRVRTTLEATISERNSSPEENYTPGVITGIETLIISDPVTETEKRIPIEPIPNPIPKQISPMPHSSSPLSPNKRPRIDIEPENDSFIQTLFNAMEASGFPRPSKRPRFSDQTNNYNFKGDRRHQKGGGRYRHNSDEYRTKDFHRRDRRQYNNYKKHQYHHHHRRGPVDIDQSDQSIPVCRQFLSKTGCSYGDTCKYRHVLGS